MNIEQIKEEYAKENGYKSWADFLWCVRYAFADHHQALTLLQKASEQIAQRAFNAALELAAEKAEAEIYYPCDSCDCMTPNRAFCEEEEYAKVSKSSILSLKINS